MPFVDDVRPPLLTWNNILLTRYGGLTSDPDCCCPCPGTAVIVRWELTQSDPPGPNDDNFYELIQYLLQLEQNDPSALCGFKTKWAVTYYGPPAAARGEYPICAWGNSLHWSCNEELPCFLNAINLIDQDWFGTRRIHLTVETGVTCEEINAEWAKVIFQDECRCAEEDYDTERDIMLNLGLTSCCGTNNYCPPYDYPAKRICA